jgi:hypothetical protein
MLKEKIFASGELIRFFDNLSNSLVLSMKTSVLSKFIKILMEWDKKFTHYF